MTTIASREAAPPESARPVLTWRSWLGLPAILILFLIMRLPPMYAQPGGQDEYLFTVPGWTVLREGIPRIPYAPARNRDSAFYRSDVMLFALPPGYFYWQAPFFAVAGPSYGTARLASAVAGLIAVVFLFLLSWHLYRDEHAALWASGLYSFSRVFFFPSMTARPDMLCGAIGLAALYAGYRWHESARTSWIVAAGVLVGAGMLVHPFAIVYALQLGIWVLAVERGWWPRLRSATLLTAAALLVFCLWVPLILSHPELFRVQFFNNVLDRSGPGLLERLIFPFESIVTQSLNFVEHAGPWQSALMVCALLLVTVHDLLKPEERRAPGRVAAIVLAWSSVYLLIACQGTHVTKGYWCYSGALVFVCVGRLARIAHDAVGQLSLASIWRAAGAGLLIALMLPGAGLRATWAYIQHRGDPAYNSPQFVSELLEHLPADAQLIVDPAHVFEVYVTGRPTLLGTTVDFYFDVRGRPYDYLIAGRYDLERDVPQELNGRFLRSYGRREDIFASYAEIYRSSRQP